MAEFGRRAGFRIQWIYTRGGSNPPFGTIKVFVSQMKEIKPRIVLSSNRERRGWGLSSFILVLISFVIGVLVGMRINSINLLEKEQIKTSEKRDGDKSEIKMGEKGNENDVINQLLTPTVEVDSAIGESNIDQLTSEKDDFDKSFETPEQKVGTNPLEIFTVQVGAFTNLNRAEAAQKGLIGKGYAVIMVPYINSLNEKWYLLQIGKFNSREEASDYASHYNRREGKEAIVEKLE